MKFNDLGIIIFFSIVITGITLGFLNFLFDPEEDIQNGEDKKIFIISPKNDSSR